MNNDQRDKLLVETHGLITGLVAYSKTHEERLNGHGTAIRKNSDEIDAISIYQGKCQTRWKGVGWVVIPILGTLAAGVVGQLIFKNVVDLWK